MYFIYRISLYKDLFIYLFFYILSVASIVENNRLKYVYTLYIVRHRVSFYKHLALSGIHHI